LAALSWAPIGRFHLVLISVAGRVSRLALVVFTGKVVPGTVDRRRDHTGDKEPATNRRSPRAK